MFVVLLLFPVEAAAQTASSSSTYRETANAAGQSVVFSDDLATAGDLGPLMTPQVARRPSAVRMGLIRPRASFVPELVKSVENL